MKKTPAVVSAKVASRKMLKSGSTLLPLPGGSRDRISRWGAEAGGRSALLQEEVPDGGHGRGEDQGGADAAEDAEDEDEMPVC